MSLSVSCDGCYKNSDSEAGFEVMKISIGNRVLKTLHWCNNCLITKEHLSIWLKNPHYIPVRTEEADEAAK